MAGLSTNKINVPCNLSSEYNHVLTKLTLETLYFSRRQDMPLAVVA
jgi:hypothetical protein